jgi:hypothetical protein
MCGEHGHSEEGGFRGARGFRGPRGFGWRGIPSREEWVERLEAHRERLERDLANVRDLIARLSDEPPGQPAGS